MTKHQIFQEQVNDFLYHQGRNPFLKRTKVVLFKTPNELDDLKIIQTIFEDIYQQVVFTTYHQLQVIFISGKNDLDLQSLFITISADLGYDLLVHDGIYINNQTTRDNIINYFKICSNVIDKSSYSDLASMLLMLPEKDYFPFLRIINESNFSLLYQDVVAIEVINALVKNNLNVLKTSKVLYLHRNSILNKIEMIYKETGLNMQNFKHAFVIKQLLSLNEKK